MLYLCSIYALSIPRPCLHALSIPCSPLVHSLSSLAHSPSPPIHSLSSPRPFLVHPPSIPRPCPAHSLFTPRPFLVHPPSMPHPFPVHPRPFLSIPRLCLG